MQHKPTSLLVAWSLTLTTDNMQAVTQFINAWLPTMVAIHEVELTRHRTQRRLELAQVLESPSRQTVWFDDVQPSAFSLRFQHPYNHSLIASTVHASFFTKLTFEPMKTGRLGAWPTPSKLVITWREGLTVARLSILRY